MLLRRVGRVYFVLARDVETVIEVKRSRFVCTLRRVEGDLRSRGFAVLDTSYGATGVTLRLGGPADDG